VRRSSAHDDPPDRPPASIARLAAALIDLQMLLHRAVAFGRGVVVDGAAASFDRLCEDVAQRLVEAARVGGPESVGVAERVELRPPERKSWFINNVLSRPRRRARSSASRRAVKSSASGSAPVARTPIASPSMGRPVAGSRR